MCSLSLHKVFLSLQQAKYRIFILGVSLFLMNVFCAVHMKLFFFPSPALPSFENCRYCKNKIAWSSCKLKLMNNSFFIYPWTYIRARLSDLLGQIWGLHLCCSASFDITVFCSWNQPCGRHCAVSRSCVPENYNTGGKRISAVVVNWGVIIQKHS